MGQHDALGLGRRSRREDHLRDGVRGVRDGRAGEPARCGIGGQRGQLPDRRLATPIGSGTASPTSTAGRRRSAPRAGSRPKRGSRSGRARRREQAAPQRDDPLGPILSPDDDVLSLDDALGVEARRKGARPFRGVAIGQRPGAIAIVEHQELAADAGRSSKKSISVRRAIPLNYDGKLMSLPPVLPRARCTTACCRRPSGSSTAAPRSRPSPRRRCRRTAGSR